MGDVVLLRTDEKSMHKAVMNFLRSAACRQAEADRLFDLIVELDVTDEWGRPALFTANAYQRRRLMEWLIENTGKAA